MLSARVIDAMGLLKLQSKDSTAEQSTQPSNTAQKSSNTIAEQAKQHTAKTADDMAVVKLDKSEFRLLVKMLQAIGHECSYDAITTSNEIVTYQHPNKTLVFNDINHPDSDQIMNLSSLTDLLSTPELKRAVWEKLKTLK